MFDPRCRSARPLEEMKCFYIDLTNEDFGVMSHGVKTRHAKQKNMCLHIFFLRDTWHANCVFQIRNDKRTHIGHWNIPKMYIQKKRGCSLIYFCLFMDMKVLKAQKCVECWVKTKQYGSIWYFSVTLKQVEIQNRAGSVSKHFKWILNVVISVKWLHVFKFVHTMQKVEFPHESGTLFYNDQKWEK